MAVLLLAVGLWAAPGVAGRSPASPVAAATGQGCTGPSIPASFSGTLTVDTTASAPPSAQNVSVTLTYFVELNYTPRITGQSQYSCASYTASTVTNATGGFALNASVPATVCGGSSCSIYSGPFGNATFSAAPVPGGYFTTATVNGSHVAVALVEALASATTVPGLRVTLSTNAPTVVTALGWAGNGAPSPAVLGDAWSLSGTGWTMLGSNATASTTIEAAVGATPGVLRVNVSATFNGSRLPVASARLDIAAAGTATSSGSLSATSVDAGSALAFQVTGTGAIGYNYTAALRPGLGAATVVAACTPTPIAGGEVALACAGTVVYASAGTAQPVVTLSNGFSFATWTYPDVVVAPRLGISVAPDPLVVYAATPTSVDVLATAGSGTAPLGPACLWPGDGGLLCADAGAGSPGGAATFAFALSYPSAGSYSGRASLSDAGGGNVSANFTAEVFARPALSPVVASGNRVVAGTNVTLSAVVSGGALPLAYWWNTSAPGATVYSGSLARDGSIVLVYRPTLAGATRITLTVVDALGTVVASPTPLAVTAGPAVALGPEGPDGTWTVPAGTPYPVHWAALDPFGEVVGNYSGPVALTIAPAAGGTSGELWVNSTLAGAVPAGANGSFAFPASDWRAGFLNFSIDAARAGVLRIGVDAPLPLAGLSAGGPALTVTPDLADLRLSEPLVATAGSRTNATLWTIDDRFGNPVPGGFVVVRAVFGGATALSQSPILVNGTGSRVWVNFSAPAATAGTVYVVSEWNQSLLGPIDVPAAASATAPIGWVLLAFALSALGAVALTLLRYRRRGRDPGAAPEPASAPAPSVDDELRRLAEGRDHVLSRADPSTPRTLDELAAGFSGSPPTPEELTEWVSSLVAEGSLTAQVGADGRPRFRRAAAAAGPATLRVELDDRALDEALRHRAEAGPEPPDDGTPPP